MSITLNSGGKMPQIGLGTWAGMDPKERAAAQGWFSTALKAGYRHIDTAHFYGTEVFCRNAIRESGIPREEIFITTKLPAHHHERVAESLEESFSNLGLDYIDLYLMHCPQAILYDETTPLPRDADGVIITTDYSLNDTWADMEKLLATGKVKAIGVSNFSIKTLDQLFKTAKVVPAVNQVELHPYLTQNELLAYCKAKGIVITAFAATGYANVREDPLIVQLAVKYGVTPTQVILAWHISRGCVVIPKSANPQRQKENLQLPSLEADDNVKITALDRNERLSNKADETGRVFGWTYEQLGW
ncbi:hypothetical protein HGRIS_006720 [Hohenbuehelia grisea]|uniref:NADP-dependent oxidoreductase domain-containing protein n=1 Tax=Hohenbuehelia grisea TaxID=104357 RepID=A0ABR3JAY1_9AGAR